MPGPLRPTPAWSFRAAAVGLSLWTLFLAWMAYGL